MKQFINIIILGIFLLMTSCEKLIDIDPRQEIDAEDALTNPEAVSAATISLYARLRSVSLYGRDMIAIPELLADNADNTGAGNRLVGQSLNQPRSHMSNWQASYYGINECNLVLEALDNLEAGEAFKRHTRGQALFLRGLFYHNLLRVYAYDPTAIVAGANKGGVPIMLNGVTAVEQIVYGDRKSIESGYELVYSDLTEAYSLLEGVSSSRAPHYATQGAVAAIMSRVALYNGDYARVVEEANNAFASGAATFPLSSGLVASWRSEVHPESFFEVMFTTPDNVGSNESLRATFMTRTTIDSDNPASHGNVVLSENLYDQYADDDIRRELVMLGAATTNRTLHEITKFASKNGVPNLDNVPVIRYAEVILNKAEAHYRLGETEEANAELNRIRERAGLATVNLVGDELMAEILQQRRIEFAFEGHRFFDLKRLGMDIVKPTGNILFDDYRILANIPTREIDVNPNLEQNNGY